MTKVDLPNSKGMFHKPIKVEVRRAFLYTSKKPRTCASLHKLRMWPSGEEEERFLCLPQNNNKEIARLGED